MHYPLVESSLLKEILRTWQRPAMSNATRAGVEERMDRLTKLLQFLKVEVRKEERILMAFKGKAENAKREKTKGTKYKAVSSQKTATVSALISTGDKRKNCIFCNDNDENAACDKAKKLFFEAGKNIALNVLIADIALNIAK